MTVDIGSAAAAYARQAQSKSVVPMDARSKDPGTSFADLLGQAVSSAISTGRQAEAISAQAMAGKADLREVVSAVTNAELTLQAALAIRDRVVQAYQDIMRMPI